MAPGPPKEFGARKVPLRFRPYLLVILLICPLLAASPAWPQTEAGQPASPKPLKESQVQANDAALRSIQALRTELAELAKRAEGVEGVRKTVYERRLNDRWLALLSAATGFAQKVAAQRDGGYDVTAYLPDVELLLDKLPGEVRRNIIRTELRLEDFPKESMPAEEQLADLVDRVEEGPEIVLEREALLALLGGLSVALRIVVALRRPDLVPQVFEKD